jgi:hypothetical protein
MSDATVRETFICGSSFLKSVVLEVRLRSRIIGPRRSTSSTARDECEEFRKREEPSDLEARKARHVPIEERDAHLGEDIRSKVVAKARRRDTG